MKPRISAVVAIDSKRGIGKNNRLLFRFKEDFERMRRLIRGKPIIMGRKTYESMLTYTNGKIIKGSTNIVVTHDPNYEKLHKEGCVVSHSLDEALEVAKKENPEEIIIFGGAKIYEQAMQITDRLYLTVVEGDFNADTFFPDYSEFTRVLEDENLESEGYKYKFLTLEKAL
jgi:dihydrofolate reductase